jgi:hypothetical protein
MAWRGKDKVAKDRAVRLIKKRNKYIGALAGGSSNRCSRWSGSLTYRWGRGFSGIPRMNIGGRLRNRVRFNEGNIVGREVFDNVAGSSTEAVAQRVVQQISSVKFQAGSKVESKRINMFATQAHLLREEGHHGMERHSIWKSELIASIEVRARDGGGIKRKAHVRQAWADKLRIDGGIMRHGGAAPEINSIKLIGELMLYLEAKWGRTPEAYQTMLAMRQLSVQCQDWSGVGTRCSCVA